MSKVKGPPPADFDDNLEWTDDDFAAARPALEVLPEIFGANVAAEMLKPRGRPKSAHRP